MKLGGIQLELGTWTGRLYYDDTPNTTRGYGIRIALRWGPMIWACPKFWSKVWNHDHYPTPEATWFTIRGPLVIGPFVSIVFGNKSLYAGFKDAGNVLLPSMKFEWNRYNFNK